MSLSLAFLELLKARDGQLIETFWTRYRFNALNPNGCVDFYLPSEGMLFPSCPSSVDWKPSARAATTKLTTFYTPSAGFNQYIDALSSHAGYWACLHFFSCLTSTVWLTLALSQTDPRFSTFVLTQLFAGAEDLEKTGREEIATEFDENDEV